MDDFAGWVARWLDEAEGGQHQAARLRSLLMRVHMAAERLVDGDAMRPRRVGEHVWLRTVRAEVTRVAIVGGSWQGNYA